MTRRDAVCYLDAHAVIPHEATAGLTLARRLRLSKNTVNPVAMVIVAYTASMGAPAYFGVTSRSFAVFFAIAWMMPLLLMTITDAPRSLLRTQGESPRPRAFTYVFITLGLLPWIALPLLYGYDPQSLLWKSLTLPVWSRWTGAALVVGFVLWPLAQKAAAKYVAALSPRGEGYWLAANVMTGVSLFLISANLFIALLAAAGLVLGYFQGAPSSLREQGKLVPPVAA